MSNVVNSVMESIRRGRDSWLKEAVRGFLNESLSQGLAKTTLRIDASRVFLFGEWVQRQGIHTLGELPQCVKPFLLQFYPRQPSLGIWRSTLGRFLRHLMSRGFIPPAEPELVPVHPDMHLVVEYKAYLREHRGICAPYARDIGNYCMALVKRLGIIACFLRALVREGLLHANPLAEFRARHGDASWRVLAQAFQTDNPEAALAALRGRAQPCGPIEGHIHAYLELQRSLGKAYRTHGYVLQNFNRFLHLQAVDSPRAITPELVRRWMESLPEYPTTRHEYLGIVSRFFDHLKQAEVVAVNPAAVVRYCLGRRPHRKFQPFIFSHEQMTSILSKAQQLPPKAWFPLRGPTCHTMLGLLYALGLRHGEARRLQIQDLDWDRQTLLIRETKFHKSRYVPFGPRVGQCLRRFLDLRQTVLAPVRSDDPIFTASSRAPIAHNVLLIAFRTILKELEIAAGPGERLPRLHDLRHTFAVHRLLRWYRENVDVQSRLMALSTFLGHLDPSYTQVYLTITEDLLGEANARFYRHFGQALNEEARP
jgi:integrase